MVQNLFLLVLTNNPEENVERETEMYGEREREESDLAGSSEILFHRFRIKLSR